MGVVTALSDAIFNSQHVSFSASRSLVAAGGRRWSEPSDGRDPSHDVYIWTLQTKQVAYVVKGHANEITAVCFSPDGSRLATAGEDGVLKVWETKSWSEIHSTTLVSVSSLAFSPDGQLLAVADAAEIALFETSHWQPRGRFAKDETEEYSGLAFSPDGRTLASGGYNKKVYLWNVASGRAKLLGEHGDRVLSLAWSQSTNVLEISAAEPDGAAPPTRGARRQFQVP